jgi:hypothetical protein
MRPGDGVVRAAVRDAAPAVGVPAGWVLQVALIAAGFIVADMFFIGVFFALLWYWGLQAGRRIDAEKAAAYAAYEAAQAKTSTDAKLTSET